MSDETSKREISEAEREQRREAGRRGGSASKTMTDAALEQRRSAAALSTGPRTPEGKAASSRNNWKTGEYSAISKADAWQRLALSSSKPCKSTCEEYPCSLVEEGVTEPGGDCRDKQVFVEAFDSIITTLQTADAQYSHGLVAAQAAGAVEVLEKLRGEVMKAPIAYKPLVNKEGEPVGQVPMANPVLAAYVKLLGELGINLPELMATPKAVLAKQDRDEDRDAVRDVFDRLAVVATGGRQTRTIDGEVE